MKIEGIPREMIALRVAQSIPDGAYVNLGIGIPTLVSNWLEGRDVVLQSEIGMLKTGGLATGDEVDLDLINASCQAVLELPGSVYFDICESFAMIRGGHIDVTVMGAFQVTAGGDFASWSNPARGLDGVGNVGGSMDLAAGARHLYIAMEHTTTDGRPKIVDALSYPATARGKASKIFTDLALIEVRPDGLWLVETAPGLTAADVQSATEVRLRIADDLKEMEF